MNFSHSEQLLMCEQLGAEFRRQYRYAPHQYAINLNLLREVYRSVRDKTPFRAWKMEDVVTALGQRGLGLTPMNDAANCECVPFPGNWSPNTRTTGTHWHDRSVRVCITCGRRRVAALPKTCWPATHALFVELNGRAACSTASAEAENWF